MRIPITIAVTTTVFSTCALAQTLSDAAVRDWLKGYEHAWETLDAEAAASLFTEDAQYFETPWSEPFRGRDGIQQYWSDVTAGQSDVDFDFEIIAVNAMTAVARWTADFELETSDTAIALDGVFILEFTPGAKVRELREWWVPQP